jgi:hypothetical protein
MASKNKQQPPVGDYDAPVAHGDKKLPPPPPPKQGREESMAEIFSVKSALPHTTIGEQVSRPVRMVDAWGSKNKKRK